MKQNKVSGNSEAGFKQLWRKRNFQVWLFFFIWKAEHSSLSGTTLQSHLQKHDRNKVVFRSTLIIYIGLFDSGVGHRIKTER